MILYPIWWHFTYLIIQSAIDDLFNNVLIFCFFNSYFLFYVFYFRKIRNKSMFGSYLCFLYFEKKNKKQKQYSTPLGVWIEELSRPTEGPQRCELMKRGLKKYLSPIMTSYLLSFSLKYFFFLSWFFLSFCFRHNLNRI